MELDLPSTVQSSREERGGLQIQEPQRRNARQGERQELEGRCRVATRRRAHELPPPIRGILGHKRFNTNKILEAPVTLKVQELFDIAPIIRWQITNEMKLSELRKQMAQQIQSEPATAASREVRSEPTVIQIVPKHDTIPECLYITTWVNS